MNTNIDFIIGEHVLTADGVGTVVKAATIKRVGAYVDIDFGDGTPLTYFPTIDAIERVKEVTR